jgi:hypothetical protein
VNIGRAWNLMTILNRRITALKKKLRWDKSSIDVKSPIRSSLPVSISVSLNQLDTTPVPISKVQF